MRRIRTAQGARSVAGATLVEVLVAMIILSMVLGLVTKVLIGAMDQQSTLSQQTQAQNFNNTGMELMTRLLRQAIVNTGSPTNPATPIISYAAPNTVVFTSRLSATDTASSQCTGTVTTCSTSNTPINNYEFTLPTGSTTMKWGQAGCPATGACTTTNATPVLSHTLITGVQNAGGSATCSINTTGNGIFRYWWVDTNGNPAELTVQAGQTSLTATQLAEIQYVEVDIYTATQSGPKKPQCSPLQDYVELRN